MKYVFDGGVGAYLPVFKTYLDQFWNIIKTETKMKSDFDKFRNTSIWERFMLNSAQFASAKSVAQNKALKELMFDDKGVRRSYSAFKKDAKEVTDVFNETWLRTESDTAIRQAVAGDMFRAFREDADIFPYWRYLETTSEHPREEHLELVGNVYKIGDPEGDMVMPPNGFSCSCGAEQVDDQYLDENKLSARTNDESKEDLENVSPQFRFNPADQGILPKEGHSYFNALSSANEANGNTFGIDNETGQKTKLSAIGLHQFSNLIHQWKYDYHSDGLHEIIFQNEKLLTNVVFNNKSFSNISHHAKGTHQLPDTITNCDECWSYWANPEKQTEVFRNYIKGNYVVQTEDGKIVNAYLVDNVNRFRRGVIIL